MRTGAPGGHLHATGKQKAIVCNPLALACQWVTSMPTVSRSNYNISDLGAYNRLHKASVQALAQAFVPVLAQELAQAAAQAMTEVSVKASAQASGQASAASSVMAA